MADEIPDGYREIVASLRAEVGALRRANLNYEHVIEQMGDKLVAITGSRDSWKDAAVRLTRELGEEGR